MSGESFILFKDLDTLLKAFALVHHENVNTSLYLVGDDTTPNDYQQEGVYLVGYQMNSYPWMKFADCLILASKSEACPNVILEEIFLDTRIITPKCFNQTIISFCKGELFILRILGILK